MSTITASLVKELRDATGAGMMAAKRALEESAGDQDKAAELLRIKGETKVKERGAERSATNGLVAAADGAMIQLNCETDFVAKTADFEGLLGTPGLGPKSLRALTLVANGVTSIEEVMRETVA